MLSAAVGGLHLKSYQFTRDALCALLENTADSSIRSEPEGLDVYVDVYYLSPTFIFEPINATFLNNLDGIIVNFGFKRKSSPACT